jgi:hypothetical protein
LFTLWLSAESWFQIARDIAMFLKLQMLYAPFLKNAFLNSYLKQELYVGGPFFLTIDGSGSKNVVLALLANRDSDA